MTTQNFIPYAFNYQYAAQLGARIHSPWVYDTDFALSQDEESYELMERDPPVAHAFEFRRILSAGLDWYIKPAADTPHDRKCAAIVEALLRRMANGAATRVQIQDATIKGESWHGLVGRWTKTALVGGPVRKWWYLCQLANYDKRRFRLKTDAIELGGEPSWHYEVQRPWTSTWDPIEPTFYLHHVHRNTERTLGRGLGAGSVVWPYWKYKTGCLRLWLQRLDRWALGMLIGKVALDEKSRASPDRSVRVNSMLTILEKMRAGHVAVWDIQDAIQLIEASGDGHDAKLLVDYLDDSIIRYTLASLTPSGAGGSQGPGSYARSKVEQGSREAVIKLDHSELEDRMSSTLVNLIYRANMKAIVAECGCAPTGCPEFKVKQEEERDPVLGAEVLATLGGLQVPVRKIEAYALAGLTPPTDEDLERGAVFFAPQPGAGQLSQAELGGSPSPFAIPPGTRPEDALAQTLARLRGLRPGGPGSAPAPMGSPKNRIAQFLEIARSRLASRSRQEVAQ